MKPDVVFCSIELPGRDGYEVAKEIRKSMPQNPLLVAHTSYSKREVGERAKKSGFDYLLMKPAKVDEIAQILSCVDGSLTDAELKL
jgi:two-component system CheB/CheR fusion protein